MPRCAYIVIAMLVAVGCYTVQDESPPDASRDAGFATDASAVSDAMDTGSPDEGGGDAGESRDGGDAPDGGLSPDSGDFFDAGALPDAGHPDAGTSDAGTADAGGQTEMVIIPGGPFWMGCNSTAHCYPDEEPYRQVTLSAFSIDRHEVTRGGYRACVDAGACAPPARAALDLGQQADHPVRGVDWDQADGYCRWAGKSLPTQAQWERAGRGTGGAFYPWGNDLPGCEALNFNNCVGDTTPAGSYPAGQSPEGVMDLSGNVWEWNLEYYSETYYQDAADVDPVGPDSGSLGHVYRGGAFNSGEERMDIWLRYSDDGTTYHDRRADKVGFRCAR